MKRRKRKMVVKLVESNEVSNLRIIAETIARKIKDGSVQL